MNKKGYAQLAIFGVSIWALFELFIWLFVIGPAFDQVLQDALDNLGADSFCPEEFSTEDYKVCFNAEGDVIMDGLLDDQLEITIEGLSNTCHVKAGEYDFEYSGCRLDKFKQMTAYNLVVFSRKGKISLKSATIASKILAGSGIVKIAPKGIRWLRKLGYVLRFF